MEQESPTNQIGVNAEGLGDVISRSLTDNVIVLENCSPFWREEDMFRQTNSRILSKSRSPTTSADLFHASLIALAWSSDRASSRSLSSP